MRRIVEITLLLLPLAGCAASPPAGPASLGIVPPSYYHLLDRPRPSERRDRRRAVPAAVPEAASVPAQAAAAITVTGRLDEIAAEIKALRAALPDEPPR